MIKYIKFFLILSIPVIAGCSSAASVIRTPLSIEAAAVKKVEQYLESDSPIKAYAAAKAYAERDIAAEEINSLIKKIHGQVLDGFPILLDSGDYNTAYAWFESLSAISAPEEVPNWSRNDYLLEKAKNILESENPVAALVFLDELMEEGYLDLPEALAWAETANNESWYTVLRKLVHYIEAKGGTVPEIYKTDLKGKVNFPNLIKGTVTVWVNRGIRFQRGLGYLDRVIGSGFFIDKRGYLLTNYHVIESEVNPEYEGFSRLYIRLAGDPQTKIPARVVGYDKIFDIALLKAEIDAPYVFSLFTDEIFTPGERIYAIGSPLGLESTLTSGIISAVNRRLLQVGDTIQVDVPINSGNSGGPLFNENGLLVGVVFAGMEQYEGINFAIPAQWILPLIPALYNGGRVEHSWLGLAVQETSAGLEVLYKIPGDLLSLNRLGMGDIITSINGVPVKTLRETQEMVLRYTPGTLLRLDYLSSGEARVTYLVTEDRPESPLLEAVKRDTRENLIVPLFGMALDSAGSYFWRKTYSVKKVFRGTLADETGISENDPLTIVNWVVDDKAKYAALQIYIKKRKAGFIESAIQLAAYLEIDNFI